MTDQNDNQPIPTFIDDLIDIIDQRDGVLDQHDSNIEMKIKPILDGINKYFSLTIGFFQYDSFNIDYTKQLLYVVGTATTSCQDPVATINIGFPLKLFEQPESPSCDEIYSFMIDSDKDKEQSQRDSIQELIVDAECEKYYNQSNNKSNAHSTLSFHLSKGGVGETLESYNKRNLHMSLRTLH